MPTPLEKHSAFKRRTLQLGVFSLVLATSVFFQNCSVVTSSSPGGQGGSLDQASVLGSKAMAILNNKCSFCHNESLAQGGVGNITDVNYLLFNRLVIPGQPDVSDLIRVIREGSMPPTGTQVTTAELDALTQWVQNGLKDATVGQVPSPTPLPVPMPTPNTPTASYAALASSLFTPKCVGCHNNNLASGNVNLSTYTNVKASATSGKLYSSVTRTGGNYMPQGGARLSTAELTTLNQWIMAGAPNN